METQKPLPEQPQTKTKLLKKPINNNIIEVIYSGDFNTIMKASINPETRKATTEQIITGITNSVCALEVVNDRELHKKLLEHKE